MFPFIQHGNVCRFVAFQLDELKKGDIVLFRNDRQQLVAHRLVNFSTTGGVRVFLFRGDTNIAIDSPVQENQLLGKLISIKKRKYTIKTDGWAARVWGWLILYISPIRIFLNKYTRRRMYVERL